MITVAIEVRMNDVIKIRIYKGGVDDSSSGGRYHTKRARSNHPRGERGKQTDGIRNSAVTAALISAAKQAAMQGVNKYAELSGNYNVTDNLSLVLEGASMVAMMFAGPSWLGYRLVQ